jgi:hypothetical protein
MSLCKEPTTEPCHAPSSGLLLGAEEAGEEVSYAVEEAMGGRVLAKGWCGGDSYGGLCGLGFDGHRFGAGRW